jgi:hypothetical protein
MSSSVMSPLLDDRSVMLSHASRSDSTPAITIAAPPAPKKRRRRAPTSGAADDCFTCRKEGTKCDRKRPYCQQCIDRGQTCSGYKTQLTWGVGVASRGKLRGLALPIAGSAAMPTTTTDRRARRKAASVDETALKKQMARPEKSGRATSFAGTAFVPEFTFEDFNSPMTAPLMPLPEMDWPVFEEQEQFNTLQLPQSMAAPQRSLLTENLMQLPSSNTIWDELAIPNSATTFSSWSDSDYASTVDFPATPEDVSFLNATSLPTQQHLMCNHAPSHCASPISPAFSNTMLSPTYFPGSHNFMLEGPTSFPSQRMAHARSTSTMSLPAFWEGSSASLFKAQPSHSLQDTFCDDSVLTGSSFYPSEWNAIPMMM